VKNLKADRSRSLQKLITVLAIQIQSGNHFG